ncbi:MAG: hypothetical protein E8A46_20070 [Bradyrhizobium sp.]|uniref:hypothetical protein n=1 Tax=Bradyrhizobium sp. TaxID=376 RepID=UPI0012133B47|nr:hypothetical protein [Bradyrhizobium sp.]THD49543.1 MAG: hypothetical protein E8A46_20070 [Bradyrhizobium sp.]
MTSRTGYGLAGLLVLAAGLGLTAVPANAQAVPSTEDAAATAEATEAEAAADPDDADIKDLELDWSQLNVDAYTLMTTSPASKARMAPRAANTADMAWSSKDKPNGSAVSVKQPISPFWDARIGADMTVTRQPSTMSELLSEKIANGGSEPQSSGTAWAAITAPGVGSIWDKTAIEARVDPSQEQGKLGTSVSKSLPLSEQYSLTLQNGYNVIQQGIVPVPGLAGRTTRNYETEQSAKLSIADTGTSFSAGQTLSSSDDKWLRKVGAEQKLFGGVSISGSISETPLGTSSKSLTAGFKQSW